MGMERVTQPVGANVLWLSDPRAKVCAIQPDDLACPRETRVGGEIGLLLAVASRRFDG